MMTREEAVAWARRIVHAPESFVRWNYTNEAVDALIKARAQGMRDALKICGESEGAGTAHEAIEAALKEIEP